MLIVYKNVSAEDVRKEAEQAKKDIAEWFKTFPNKKVCNAEMWYGLIKKIRRDHIELDIHDAVNATLA